MPVLHEEACVNHPQRAAIENCEVCGQPLCNYCLYYTDDGQRLCKTHAIDAAKQGLGFNPPETYSEGILSSQARAGEAQQAAINPDVSPKGAVTGPPVLYRGNNSDLMGFVGMLTGVFTMLSLCGGGICIPVVGIFLSIAALLNAGDAVDRRRTRLQGFIGLGASMTLVVVWLGVAALCFWTVQSSNDLNTPIYYTPFPSQTPRPTRTRAPIHTLTPTPDDASDDPSSAAWSVGSNW